MQGPRQEAKNAAVPFQQDPRVSTPPLWEPMARRRKNCVGGGRGGGSAAASGDKAQNPIIHGGFRVFLLSCGRYRRQWWRASLTNPRPAPIRAASLVGRQLLHDASGYPDLASDCPRRALARPTTWTRGYLFTLGEAERSGHHAPKADATFLREWVGDLFADRGAPGCSPLDLIGDPGRARTFNPEIKSLLLYH